MAQYHINPQTGNPGVCRAAKACPFGPPDLHYKSPDEARLAYENDHAPFPGPPSLKKLTHEELRLALLTEAQLSTVDLRALEAAIDLAEELHEPQRRKAQIQGRINTPYVEHPLRNALRLVRLGVRDPAVLIATVLHDTVEDCGKRFQEIYGNAETELSEPHRRELLSAHIRARFGDRTLALVLGVTNPHEPASVRRKQTQEEKHAKYAEQVAEEISASPDVYLVKLSDYIDNAGSLHHATTEELPGAKRRASKYLPLIPVFQDQLHAHEFDLPRESIQELNDKLSRTEERLHGVLARDN